MSRGPVGGQVSAPHLCDGGQLALPGLWGQASHCGALWAQGHSSRGLAYLLQRISFFPVPPPSLCLPSFFSLTFNSVIFFGIVDTVKVPKAGILTCLWLACSLPRCGQYVVIDFI